jgi:hypothetical protein
VLRAQAARLRRLPHVRRRGRGRGDPPISCSREAEPGWSCARRRRELRQIRKTNLELIFSDHNAYCLPPCQNKCPSHIDIPGFLKANTEANWRESARIFKRTIPFPSVLGRVCPAPCEEHCRRDEVEEAIAIRDSHRYAGDQVLKASSRGVDPPMPFERQPASGQARGGHRLRARGHVAAYYLLLNGHDVTVFERDPAPGGMLRYGIPQYRLPKVEVLEAEYESVWRLGGKLVCTNAELGTSTSPRRPPEPGLRRGLVAIGCYDTNKLGIPARTPTASSTASSTCARHPGPALPGPRGQARRRHRRRLHLDGLLAHLGAPGRVRGDARLPPRHEGHARVQRGPRDARGGRTAIFQAGPTRVITDEAPARSPASSSSAWRWASPTHPGAAGRSRCPAPSSSSSATASSWPSARART